jgi:uncharacterized protein (TIGR03437 family)
LAAAVIGSAATLVRSPYLQNVRPDAATVVWTTSEPGRGSVDYSADQSYAQTASAFVRTIPATSSSATFYRYQAELTGLRPGRDYFYRVRVDGEILKEGTRFRTAGPDPFTFLVFGDSGTGGQNQLRLADLMTAGEDPALVLHTGDVSQYESTFAQLDSTFFGVYTAMLGRIPFYPTPGNHDYYTERAVPYLEAFSPPDSGTPARDAGRYYSFDWGNVHFVSLDSNLLGTPDATARMLEWLDGDLGRQNRFWKIAYFHHPPYPASRHVNDPLCGLARLRFAPVLERYGVHLVLSGHEHTYQRSLPLRDGVPVEPGSGTVYITTGGGGGDLHPVGSSPLLAVGKSEHHYLRCEVRDSGLRITSIGIGGNEIDQVTLAPAPAISKGAVVNAASFTPELAPGSLISIFGSNLAFERLQASSMPLPAEMSGTSVSLNGARLPLLFVSPDQVNAQLPYGALGPANLRVTTPGGSAETSVVVSEVAPAVLMVSGGGVWVPALVRAASGALVSGAAPARSGDFLTVYAVGLGELNRGIAAGQPAPGSPPVGTLNPVQVRIDDVSLTPSFAGLSPGFAGVYQVNVQLPDGLRGGSHSLVVVVGATGSKPVSFPVGSPPGP